MAIKTKIKLLTQFRNNRDFAFLLCSCIRHYVNRYERLKLFCWRKQHAVENKVIEMETD